jgi:hypothetical protein
VLLGCWVVVPRGSVIVLDRFDVSRIDGVGQVEQAAGGGLLDESVEEIVDDVFEIGERPVNRVSGWWFVEAAVVPDEAVLEFSCNRPCSVDVLVVAVQKAAKEVWWLVYSCSPPLRGANTSYASRNSNSRCSNNGTVSVAAVFNTSLTEATSCRALVLLDTVSKPCGLLWEAFYDTRYLIERTSQAGERASGSEPNGSESPVRVVE